MRPSIPRPCRRVRAARQPRRGIAAGLALALILASPAFATAPPLRIAFGDIPSVDGLGLLIAIERTRDRGVEVHTAYYESEDVAAQAVLSDVADIGVGTPYSTIARERPPIRLIYQLNRIHFVPVLDTRHYQSWSELHGEEVTVHSRDSGTEAIARLLADRHGIEYERINYVPGSEVRAGAMLAGDLRATLVDSAGWRLLREHGGERYQAVALDDLRATDDALYATKTVLAEHAAEIDVLLEEVLRTWQEIEADPTVVARLREQYDLMPNLPPHFEPTITHFYRDAVSADVFPEQGGSLATVRHDLKIYLDAAQGSRSGAADLDLAELWDFAPVRAARERLNVP